MQKICHTCHTSCQSWIEICAAYQLLNFALVDYFLRFSKILGITVRSPLKPCIKETTEWWQAWEVFNVKWRLHWASTQPTKTDNYTFWSSVVVHFMFSVTSRRVNKDNSVSIHYIIFPLRWFDQLLLNFSLSKKSTNWKSHWNRQFLMQKRRRKNSRKSSQ